MGVWRKWIFPILRLIIFAAIAVALVKVAFFPAGEVEESPAFPTGELTEPVTTVAKGSIVNSVTLDATVSADPAQDAKATLAGDILKLNVTVGAKVAAGAVIATVRKEIPQEPVTDVDENGNERVTQPKPKWQTADVKAPVAGIVSSIAVLVNQTVEIGGVVAKVAPTTFSVGGTLAPEDQYRLLQKPTEATVDVVGGPAGFSCTNLVISNPLEGADDSGGGEGGEGAEGGSGGARIRCSVPADVTVFPGLTATMTVESGSVENVLVLPITAVKGSAGTGVVWVMNKKGKPEEKPVKIGMTDGSMIEIIEGLKEGDEVLEFVPGAEADNPEEGGGCEILPDGSEVCEG